MVNIIRKNKTTFPPLLHLTYDLQQLSDKLLDRLGVGLGQVRILSGLSTGAAVSQKALAVSLHQTEANISRQLRILKKQGLVSITKNKKDSRTRDVKLTAKGAKKCQAAIKLLDQQHKNLLKTLAPKERAHFNHSLTNIQKSLGSSSSEHRKLLG